ncbi:MAG: amidohydrolase [Clostridiales bacterium]|jgi:predicted TIM-barrel fold metal-dependent hydrolase|nr:amidohydrolase [Clostridiales bacterium]
MVVDAHYHPMFVKDLCETEELCKLRKDQQAYYKTGRTEMERMIEVFRVHGIDRCILLPHDYSTTTGDFIENEKVREFVDRSGGAFWGFASVDPMRSDAPEVVEHAFRDLGLSGLKLHPAKQKFFPQDEKMFPIYELCQKYGKPITFHAGLSWQPNAICEFARPVHFEPVAATFPKLRISLAHMGFPWIAETCALLAKYPNMYADTAAMYFDSAYEFYKYMFTKAIDATWLDRGIRHQVMFGTNYPRWHGKRAIHALEMLGLREETVELIKGRNALEFLGEEEATWLS